MFRLALKIPGEWEVWCWRNLERKVQGGKRCRSDSDNPGQFTGELGPGESRYREARMARRGGRQSSKCTLMKGEGTGREMGMKMPNGRYWVDQPARHSAHISILHGAESGGTLRFLPKLLARHLTPVALNSSWASHRKVGEGSNFYFCRYRSPWHDFGHFSLFCISDCRPRFREHRKAP